MLATGSMTEMSQNQHPLIYDYFHNPRARAAIPEEKKLILIQFQRVKSNGNQNQLRMGRSIRSHFKHRACSDSCVVICGYSTKHYRMYAVYINESVSGLSVDAAVKYNGVDVGTVKSIQIDAENPQLVFILLKTSNRDAH